MSAKKLDLERAVERELNEPKLQGKLKTKPEIRETAGQGEPNGQSFEIRLKSEADEARTQTALDRVQPGMTPDEVTAIAGRPNSTIEWYSGNVKYNYGDVWVIIEDDIVTCLVKADAFEKYWGRSDYENRNPEALLK